VAYETYYRWGGGMTDKQGKNKTLQEVISTVKKKIAECEETERKECLGVG
jgi:hypothetical protein